MTELTVSAVSLPLPWDFEADLKTCSPRHFREAYEPSATPVTFRKVFRLHIRELVFVTHKRPASV